MRRFGSSINVGGAVESGIPSISGQRTSMDLGNMDYAKEKYVTDRILWNV